MTITWLSHGEANVPETLDWLTPGEAERARGMPYPKRRTEFVLSRWTAKSALARRLGLAIDVPALIRLEIRNAADGAPEAWLDGTLAPVALSLTDRAGWAVCALAEPGIAIGCDLELVEPRSAAFVADYLTPAERRTVADGVDEDDRQRLANLLWSAKESALKALRTGLRRDTRSVEVALGLGPEVEWLPFSVTSVEGRRFFGWWRAYERFLLTVAAEVEIPPPVAMVEPPGLATGVPTHSGLATLA